MESCVKPTTKQELVDGIKKFWAEKVSVCKCNNYIDNVLKNVIQAVIAAEGDAT